MRINVIFREDKELLDVGFGPVQTMNLGTRNYERLSNKPTINSVELIGALTAEDLGLGRIYYDTTATWDLQSSLVGIAGAVYIYSDYTYLEDGAGNRTPIAGIKIGDGNAYLSDLPFVSDSMTYTIVSHISDTSMHTTPREKAFWNNKVSSFLGGQEGETLILSKTHYEDNGQLIEG